MTKNKPSRGILMFAHNNQEIDYLRLAILNSYLIQKNLKLTPDQITIVTDKSTYDYVISVMNEDVVLAAAEYQFVETDFNFKYANTRTFKDTYSNPKVLPFYNKNRSDAYDLSPYDETILIDADYLIFSNMLDHCWGHENELMMNWQYHDVMFDRKFPDLDRVNPLGITMYWATVVYFRKSDYCKLFFDIVKDVRDNKEFYRDLYKFPGGIYRNDFSFSIAAHMISGFKDKGLPQLPFKLFKTFDNDDIHKVEYENLYLYLEKPRSPGDFMLASWSGIDIHIMNKWAVNRISDELFRVYLPRDLPVRTRVEEVVITPKKSKKATTTKTKKSRKKQTVGVTE